ncbi:hypothetical protein C2W62_45665 [Candidatus Entotheonella serta]|nr:hypothetical protein C2W62_45665 [Candidatus Entotheonella serta]
MRPREASQSRDGGGAHGSCLDDSRVAAETCFWEAEIIAAHHRSFEVLEGMIVPKSIVILEFESMEHAKQWYESSE